MITIIVCWSIALIGFGLYFLISHVEGKRTMNILVGAVSKDPAKVRELLEMDIQLREETFHFIGDAILTLPKEQQADALKLFNSMTWAATYRVLINSIANCKG